jgi:hypothetical protein
MTSEKTATYQHDGQINQNPVHPFAQKYSIRVVGQISGRIRASRRE